MSQVTNQNQVIYLHGDRWDTLYINSWVKKINKKNKKQITQLQVQAFT